VPQLCNTPAGVTHEAIVHLGPCTDGTVVCKSASDCGHYQQCGYRSADGCSATTEYCFDSILGDDDVIPACSCDGGDVDWGPGNGYDGTHVPAPVSSLYGCGNGVAADAGSPDAADASDASSDSAATD
jgi:hypothetical protein